LLPNTSCGRVDELGRRQRIWPAGRGEGGSVAAGEGSTATAVADGTEPTPGVDEPAGRWLPDEGSVVVDASGPVSAPPICPYTDGVAEGVAEGERVPAAARVADGAVVPKGGTTSTELVPGVGWIAEAKGTFVTPGNALLNVGWLPDAQS
jgi:hypothetical protein